jgi:hypothetical protein
MHHAREYAHVCKRDVLIALTFPLNVGLAIEISAACLIHSLLSAFTKL